MKLPQGLSQTNMENRWASLIEPVISRSQNNSLILKNITLIAGSNTINHLLGQKLSGWKTTRINAAVTIYDNQDANQTPHLTLVLIASAPAKIELEVF